jgi:CDP-diacylglycerol---serine O-phosphatidyltransferase
MNYLMKRHIPNFITSLNLAAGFIAIIFAANGEVVTGSWLILAAMVFDFLDGFSARLLKAYSVIGKELDSLADVVSFGVAPAIIIYQLLVASLSPDGPEIFSYLNPKITLLLLSPVIMPVCAALRLAIFNTDETQATSFKGLPTPANALAVVSIVIAQHYSDTGAYTFLTGSAAALVSFMAIASILMVTRIPLLSLKFTHLKLKGNEGRYSLIILVVVSLAVLGFAAAPLIIPLYIVSSLISLSLR